ncbi:barttin [Nelusetta ayraudi]|uniref:barttin n=1 Tax=Nelusetta ayraudi TaxID=303726 RepID=UPI003F70C58E
MAEGKPYRYGLIAAGLCLTALGLFVMTQERPHVYATMCALGAGMACVGTAWSLCQCYPKVVVEAASEVGKGRRDLADAAAVAGRDGRYRFTYTLVVVTGWCTV